MHAKNTQQLDPKNEFRESFIKASEDYKTSLQGLLAFLPIMTGNVLLLIGSLVIMFVYSPLLALVSLVVVPSCRDARYAATSSSLLPKTL